MWTSGFRTPPFSSMAEAGINGSKNRNYLGSINLSSSLSSEKFVDGENFKAEMKNGILRMLIPNITTTTSHLHDENYGGLYPFQVSGPIEPYEALVIDEHTVYVRIDMPGVIMEEFTSKVAGNSVSFAGKAAKESDNDDREQRGYFGRIDFSCGCCDVTDVKCEIKVGVLRMLMKINQ